MNLRGRRKAAGNGSHGQEGSIGDLLSVGLCILAMITIMLSFMDCMALVNQKSAVGQIARNYILKMETVGYLTAGDRDRLLRELTANGVTQVDLTGTTENRVTYGTEITLRIRGKIGGRYAFEEVRVSTAKN